MKLKVKLLHQDAKLPTRGTEKSSGLDLYSLEDVYIYPGQTKIIRTGVSFQIPSGYEIQVRPRSGLSLNSNLIVKNSPGTIDQDYSGECKIIMHNLYTPLVGHSDDEPVYYKIERGQRIAQAVLVPVLLLDVEKVENFDILTGRGINGFGSTGE